MYDDHATPDAGPAPAHKPMIIVGPGLTQTAVEKALACLAQTGRFYRYGSSLVTVTADPATGEATLRQLGSAQLRLELDALAYWYTQGRARKLVRLHPPANVVKAVLHASHDCVLPVLAGVAHQPFLRTDGTLCTQEGYDTATGIVAGFSASEFNVAAHPTRADAEAAVGRLEAMLEEFAFESELDRAAALSAILTAVVRPSLAAAPLYHVTARQPGTGKSYLCKVVAAFASEQPATPLSFPHGNAECEKVLVAALREAPAVIEFDNVTRDIPAYDSLCSVLTSGDYAARNLGRSQLRPVSTRSLFLASGNSVEPLGDMARRCVTIRLDARCALPAARSFKNERLLEDMRARRTALVSDALTIVRAWLQAGRPRRASGALAGFRDWSDLCREPLVWLGKPDPAASVFIAMASGTRTVCSAADTGAERTRRETPARVGQWLRRCARYIVAGLRLVKADIARSAPAWRFVRR